MPSDRPPPEPHGDEPPLDAADLRRLAARNVGPDEVRRQLRVLSRPARSTPLLRACRLGDGVHSITAAERPELLRRWRRAADGGRLQKLVPASGAATRMFRDLRARAADPPPGSRDRLQRAAVAGEPGAAAVLRFLDELDCFPFAAELESVLAGAGLAGRDLRDRGAYQPILAALLEPEGLGYGSAAKALIPFHRYSWGSRTAFAEQLFESAGYLAGAGGRCRIQFTISPGHQPAFEAELTEVLRRPAPRPEISYEVGFSSQDAATDTVAVDSLGRLFRDAAGRVLFRPSGHGALLPNLEALTGDLVLLQNIDNVVPEDRQDAIVLWRRLLIGFTARLEEALAELRRQLEAAPAGPTADAAAARLQQLVTVEPPPALAAAQRRSWALDRLRRPLRVCGVVPNAGEPGGGPFWAAEDGGGSGQIVEPPEVDSEDPSQRRIWESSTHFNPVNMVLSLRDPDGRPHRLAAFVDERRQLLVRRHYEGRDLVALERPGLWNGAMAGWNTCFVELPAATFNPVKTVFDLLRPEHQPPAG